MPTGRHRPPPGRRSAPPNAGQPGTGRIELFTIAAFPIASKTLYGAASALSSIKSDHLLKSKA
jgi:hypothetical protein